MTKTSPQLFLCIYFNQFVKASISGRRSTASGRRISKGTIVNYGFVQTLLQEYEEKNNLQLRIRLLHKASMRSLQREKKYWARFFHRFSDFLYNHKGFYDNYVSSVFKILKTFFNYLQTEKGYIVGNYHKSFRVPIVQATPVVLQPWQLQFLITNKEFEASLRPNLKRARDIFIFGCTVALHWRRYAAKLCARCICALTYWHHQGL